MSSRSPSPPRGCVEDWRSLVEDTAVPGVVWPGVLHLPSAKNLRHPWTQHNRLGRGGAESALGSEPQNSGQLGVLEDWRKSASLTHFLSVAICLLPTQSSCQPKAKHSIWPAPPAPASPRFSVLSLTLILTERRGYPNRAILCFI